MERVGGKARGWILHVHFWWQFFYSSLWQHTSFFITSRFYTGVEKNFFLGSASVHFLVVCRVDDGLLFADSCFLHLPMHPRCPTGQYLLLMSELESLTRPNNTGEQSIFDNGREGGESSLFPRKLVFLKGGCLNCRQLYLACLLLFEHSSKYKQDALHATFPLLRTPLHRPCCFHATSAILGSFPSAIVVCGTAAVSPPSALSTENKEDVIY